MVLFVVGWVYSPSGAACVGAWGWWRRGLQAYVATATALKLPLGRGAGGCLCAVAVGGGKLAPLPLWRSTLRAEAALLGRGTSKVGYAER